MANNCDSRNVQRAIHSRDEMVRGLQRELEKSGKLKTEEPNAAGSSCSSPSTKVPTCLEDRLAEFFSNPSSHRKGGYPPPAGYLGLSPSRTMSSDNSSMSGLNTQDMDRKDNAMVRLPCTPPERPGRGRASTSNGIAFSGTWTTAVIGQDRAEPTSSNSPVRSSAASAGRAKGRGGVPAPIPSGRPKGKVVKKRKRPSKQRPMTTVKATKEEFLPTVQKLTGYKDPPVVRPQPESSKIQREREKATSNLPTDVGLDSRNPPARPLDSSLKSRMSGVQIPTPTVSNRVPEAPFSSGKSYSLNYCMGYNGQIPPQFLQDEYDENLGQQHEDGLHLASGSLYRPDSELIQAKNNEVRTTAPSLTGGSVQDASHPHSGSEGNEGIPREERSLFGVHDSGSMSPFSYPIITPSSIVEFPHRPGDSIFELEFENQELFRDTMVDLFLNYQS